jgi:hypothetical protein
MIERRLEHENGEAQIFDATLPGVARVGLEASINALWFWRSLYGNRHNLWVGARPGVGPVLGLFERSDQEGALGRAIPARGTAFEAVDDKNTFSARIVQTIAAGSRCCAYNEMHGWCNWPILC